MKLHLLSDGYLKLDRSFLVYQKYMGLSYNASLKALLVVNAKKSILIDTGCGQLPEKCAKLYVVKRKPRESLKLQLANRGYEPEDIDIVVNTHLHFDHCGNNRLFPNAKFIVQAEEFRYAYEPDRFQQMAYIRESFDVDVDYELVSGKHRVSVGVFVFPTPGHSIGHQSVVVKAEGKSFVYCGDAAPTRENLERRNVPGILYCAHKALESIDHLRKIRNAVYIYSHDNEQVRL